MKSAPLPDAENRRGNTKSRLKICFYVIKEKESTILYEINGELVSLIEEAEETFYKKAMVLKELKRNDEAEFCLARGRKYKPKSVLLKKEV